MATPCWLARAWSSFIVRWLVDKKVTPSFAVRASMSSDFFNVCVFSFQWVDHVFVVDVVLPISKMGPSKVMVCSSPTASVLGYGPRHEGSSICNECIMGDAPPHFRFINRAHNPSFCHFPWLLLWSNRKTKSMSGNKTTKQSTTSSSWRAAWWKFQ